MYIFFHIPKAAGTTIRELVRLQINAQSVLILESSSGIAYMPDHALNSVDLISGHIGIKLLDRIHKPYLAFTMLRDPVQRVISQYRYLIDAKLAPQHVQAGLKEALLDNQDPYVQSLFCNTQTWTFVGDYNYYFRNINIPDDIIINIAKDNLKKLDFFGVTEDLDLSLLAMSRLFQWDLKNDLYLNRSERKEVELDPELEHIIVNNNKLDLELYEWAKEYFYARCNSIVGRIRRRIVPNDFSDAYWINGISCGGNEKNIVFFFVNDDQDAPIKEGNKLRFAKSGLCTILKLETLSEERRRSYFVTVDKELDPIGDGFPNYVIVEEGRT